MFDVFDPIIDRGGRDAEDIIDIRNNALDFARKTLQREDRAIWYLRHVKQLLAGTISADDRSKPLQRWMDRSPLIEGAQHLETLREVQQRVAALSHTLKHYMDLPVREIQDFQFGDESFDKIIQSLGRFEDEWKARVEDSKRSLAEYGQKMIEFEDGSAWFDLERSGCRMEADAMGHCGNGSGDYSETVLSYRKPDPNMPGNWIPHLTFILNVEEGALGEMKGRANDKPAERYHDAIIALLKDDRVQRIDGGGYKPQANFSLSDLTKDQQKDLYDSKNQLFGAVETWRYEDKKVNPDIIAKMERELDVTPSMKTKNGDYKVFSGDDVLDFASTFKLKDLARYAATLKDGHYENEGYYPGIKEHYMVNEVWDGFYDKADALTRFAIRQELEAEFGDEIMDEDLDMLVGRDILQLLEQNSDCGVAMALQSALSDGDEIGTFNELYEAGMSCVKGVVEATGLKMDDEFYFQELNWEMTGSAQQMLEIMDRASTEYEHDYERVDIDFIKEFLTDREFTELPDLNEPYNGFCGFDEEAATDRLQETIWDYLSGADPELKVLEDASRPAGFYVTEEAVEFVAPDPAVRGDSFSVHELKDTLQAIKSTGKLPAPAPADDTLEFIKNQSLAWVQPHAAGLTHAGRVLDKRLNDLSAASSISHEMTTHAADFQQRIKTLEAKTALGGADLETTTTSVEPLPTLG
ncbi:hypothetical protein A3709_20285 [Halioglobus sp. HI00S01]|nr:hypothetical protein A3709_20285 [Halioglobus sp. HI00S01]